MTEYEFPEDHYAHGEVRAPGSGSRRTPVRRFIPATLQDKADDVRAVYTFYDSLCVEEFNRIAAPFKETWDKKGGLSYYRSQRPLLFAGGIPDVPDFLKDHIRPNVTFLDEVGVTGGAKQELIDALEGARRSLDAMPVIGGALKRLVISSIAEHEDRKKRKRRLIGGWDPRAIIGKDGRPTSMGPHHVGLAVDINASTNPHLKGASAQTIDAVLDHLAGKGTFPHPHRLSKPFIDFALIEREPDRAAIHAVEMWQRLMLISEAFKAFLRDSLAKTKAKQPLDPDVKALFDRCAKTFGLKKLETLAIQGVFDLNLALVVVLVTNGMRYGGEFAESKDQHHFQVRKWPFKPPKCLEQWNKKKSAAQS